MAGFFSRLTGLFGGGTGGDGGSTLPKVRMPIVGSALGPRVARVFSRLDKEHAGVSGAIAAYVEDGSQSSVLSTLSMQSLQTAWPHGTYHWNNDKDCKALFGPNVAWNTEQAARLGDVLATLDPITSGYNWGLMGSAKSPDWIRRLLSARASVGKEACSVEALKDLVLLRGLDMPVMLDILFSKHPQNYGQENSLSCFTGSADWLKSLPAGLAEAAADMAAAPRAQLCIELGKAGLANRAMGVLIDGAICSSKSVKDAARKAMTGANPTVLDAALDARFETASPGARVELIEVASHVLGEKATALLTKWQAMDLPAKAASALERALGHAALAEASQSQPEPESGGYIALDSSVVDLPPMAEIPPLSIIPDDVMGLLVPSMESFNAALVQAQQAAKGEQWHWSKHLREVGRSEIKNLKAWAERPTHKTNQGNTFSWMMSQAQFDTSGIEAFMASPHVTLRHLVMMKHARGYGGLFSLYNGYGDWAATRELRNRIEKSGDIRVAAALWKETGGSDPILDTLSSGWYDPSDSLSGDLIWPLIAENLDLIDEALGLRPQSGARALNSSTALTLLGLLPKVPMRYLMPLIGLATGNRKGPRDAARALLAGAPDIDGSIAAMLEDGKQDIRAGAAQWLGQRQAKSQVGALRTALKKEKSDICRARMIAALERCGDDVSDQFDPVKMKKEADAGLSKTGSKGLEWFPFDGLPALSWKDGTPVDPALPRWWVTLCNKLKMPGGNALVELWLDRLAPGDAHRLGWYVLTCWIEQDTHTRTEDEANAEATATVDAELKQNQYWAKQNPNYAEYYITDRDKLFAMIKARVMGVYLGSAAENKGLLSLASRVDGADAARVARLYLKNHGSRVSQCKSILEMLASNETPAAIQVVLAISNRFKARTVQAHAATLIDDIASRNGWTPEELADRTIPTAGLDETGVAELDCGRDRTYRMMLDAHDELVLLNASGKPVKALPSVRVDEEKPLLDEAKKLLATAKKEVKQVIPDQIARLREAMCLERQWTVEDWQLYVAGHPLVARLARRLVWMGLDGEGASQGTFRPLDDGTATDAHDDDVDVSAFASVQLAHASLVDVAQRDAWLAHLSDYEVRAPFDQFGRSLPVLEDADRGKTLIIDRTGWGIENFKLRGAATKIGYQRSTAEDGGWFHSYEKRYTGAELIAVIDFTGSPLPEENMAGFLKGLSFVRMRRGSNWHGSAVALGDVPPVLLAETWQDYHEIAAKGTGFDPEWEKKTPW